MLHVTLHSSIKTGTALRATTPIDLVRGVSHVALEYQAKGKRPNKTIHLKKNYVRK